MDGHPAASNSKRNFILQQGLPSPQPGVCGVQFTALQFQPRLILLLLLLAFAARRPEPYAALAAVLWWSALLPRWNPFDALWNATFARRPGGMRLAPAPAPRRCAQTIAGGLAAAIALAMAAGLPAVAVVIEVFLLAAVTALVVGRFCLGSFLCHLARRRAGFALRTMPWVRGG